MARKRTDSKENAAQIMAKSAVPITGPSNVTLSETDIPIYHNVIGEFARSQWTENALEIAAMMARTMHDLCLLYTSPSPRDLSTSRMPSSA